MKVFTKNGKVYFVFDKPFLPYMLYDFLHDQGVASLEKVRLACYGGFDNAVEIKIDEEIK